MNQKLTLSIEQNAIMRGKRYAKQHGRTLSSMVEDFLLFLDSQGDIKEDIPISATLSSLAGIGAGPVSEEDYRTHRISRNER